MNNESISQGSKYLINTRQILEEKFAEKNTIYCKILKSNLSIKTNNKSERQTETENKGKQ